MWGGTPSAFPESSHCHSDSHSTMLYRALVLAMCVSQSAALKVFVSGAGGQTGQSVFRKMLARPEFSPVGVVRSEESKAALVESGVPAERRGL